MYFISKTLLISLIVVLIFAICLWVYLRNFYKLRHEIGIAIQEGKLPLNWIKLSYLPFPGQTWYKKIKESILDEENSNDTERLDFVQILEPSAGEKDLSGCDWLIVEEHYDFDSGNRHGTTLIPLYSDNSPYRILTPSDSLVNPSPLKNNIYIFQSKKAVNEVVWATLSFNKFDHSWGLKIEISDQTPIPIMKILGKIDVLGRGVYNLSDGDHFVIENTEFQIIKMPCLEITWIENSKDKIKKLERGTKFRYPPEGDALFEIENDELKAYCTTHVYLNNLKRYPIKILHEKEIFPLSPGDKFVCVSKKDKDKDKEFNINY